MFGKRIHPATARLRLETLEDRCLPATVWGVTGANALIRFGSATPGTVAASVAITGLRTGELVKGIDFQPTTGRLFALGIVEGTATSDAAGRIYTINPRTGVATAVAAGAAAFRTTLADDAHYGIDFSPTTGALRIVNSADQSLRVSPNTGLLIATDANLNNAAAEEEVVGLAYDRSFTGTAATTLFGIDFATSSLVRQGDVNGSPSSPLGGVLTVIGAGLGFTLANRNSGFDIVRSLTATEQAFAVFTDSGTTLTGLYTIDLTTGAATLVGSVGDGTPLVVGIAVAPNGQLAAGVAARAPGVVRVFDAISAVQRFQITPFGNRFQGGIRVAVGDVNRDGVPDIITAPGAGAVGRIKVFNGVSGALLTHFTAFTDRNGAFVASGDVNGDGADDVIVGSGRGGDDRVKVFSVAGAATQLRGFRAFGGAFRGDVRVAAGDVNGDGRADVIVGAGAGPGGDGQVKVFSGAGFGLIQQFGAFGGSSATGGIFVAAGDVNGDGRADVLASLDSGNRVRAFDLAGGGAAVFADFAAFPAAAGVRLATGDVNGDGRSDILVTRGPGPKSQVRAFDGLTRVLVETFLAFDAAFKGGVFVAAGR